ncbi:MAG: HAMP domain-containing sensor histidine kinase [Vicinamibacteraceae bacterium]
MSSRWSEGLRTALTLRLGLWYAGLFALSAAVLLSFTYLLLGRALAAQDREVLESMLQRYGVAYQRSGLDGLRALVDADESEGRHERLLVRVTNDKADIIYFAQPPGWSGFDLGALDDVRTSPAGWVELANPIDDSSLEVGTRRLPRGITVQVGRSSRVRDEVLAHFRARALEVGLVVAIIAIAGGAFVSYLALYPVRALEAATHAILETGRFDTRVATRGTRDPLDRLGDRINTLLARLERLVRGMRGALDNVAHDLRTPLTRLRNVAEGALDEQEPAALRDGLGRALEEVDRVNATLTALMDISEAETGTLRLTPEPLFVAAVVDEALALHADDAEDRGIAVASRIDPALRLVADRTRLRQVVANLIENAVKYSDAGGRVDIGAAATPETVTVTIRDTGVGIGPADLPFVWDRLYRGDASRSARGLGLGLSLVKAIVEAHGGRVDVASTPGQGSAFTLTLPARGHGHGPTPPP